MSEPHFSDEDEFGDFEQGHATAVESSAQVQQEPGEVIPPPQGPVQSIPEESPTKDELFPESFEKNDQKSPEISPEAWDIKRDEKLQEPKLEENIEESKVEGTIDHATIDHAIELSPQEDLVNEEEKGMNEQVLVPKEEEKVPSQQGQRVDVMQERSSNEEEDDFGEFNGVSDDVEGHKPEPEEARNDLDLEKPIESEIEEPRHEEEVGLESNEREIKQEIDLFAEFNGEEKREEEKFPEKAEIQDIFQKDKNPEIFSSNPEKENEVDPQDPIQKEEGKEDFGEFNEGEPPMETPVRDLLNPSEVAKKEPDDLTKDLEQDDDFDFGDFNTNTVQPQETKPDFSIEKKEAQVIQTPEDDLFADEAAKKETEEFNFSSSFNPIAAFSSNVSSTFSNFQGAFSSSTFGNFANFGGFSFQPPNNPVPEDGDMDFLEEKQRKIDDDDDLFGEGEAQKKTEVPLFDGEKREQKEDSAKKERKSDYSLFGTSAEDLNAVFTRVLRFADQESSFSGKFQVLNQNLGQNDQEFKALIRQFQDKKLSLEENIALDTAEKSMGKFINENLEAYLRDRRRKNQEYKETVEKSLLAELVLDIRSLNSTWKSANLRSNFFKALNVHEEFDDDHIEQLETDHQNAQGKNKSDKKSKYALKIERNEKSSPQNAELTSPLVEVSLLKDLNKSAKKKSLEIPSIKPAKTEPKGEANPSKSSKGKGKIEEKKRESEPGSPLSAPDNNEELEKKTQNNKKITTTINTNTRSELTIIKNEALQKKIEEKNKAVQQILKSLPQYDFLFIEKIVYKTTQQIQ